MKRLMPHALMLAVALLCQAAAPAQVPIYYDGTPALQGKYDELRSNLDSFDVLTEMEFEVLLQDGQHFFCVALTSNVEQLRAWEALAPDGVALFESYPRNGQKEDKILFAGVFMPQVAPQGLYVPNPLNWSKLKECMLRHMKSWNVKCDVTVGTDGFSITCKDIGINDIVDMIGECFTGNWW